MDINGSFRKSAGVLLLVPVLMCISTPFIHALSHGQNACTSLLLVTLVVVFWRKEQAVLAGLVTGLLFYKPQLGAVVTAMVVLSAKPLTYLGLISYGAYVIHNFLSNISKRGLGRLGVHSPSEYTRAGFMFLMTLVLASISWQFFEKPINRLKRWFPYRVK